MNTPYFLYGTANADAILHLHLAMKQKATPNGVNTVSSGYLLLQFLQSIAHNKAYPFLIVLDSEMTHPPVREMLELLKTDDIYRLIPVLLLCHTADGDKDPFFSHFCTEILPQPNTSDNWELAVSLVDTFAD